MYLLLELFNRHSQNLARAAIMVLVVLVTLSLANTLLFVVDVATHEQAALPEADAPGAARSARAPAASVSIAEFNLFGAAVQQAAVTPELQDAPETKLNLTLEGVFTAENESDSTAIVAEARQPGELFQIGDTLPGNVTLTAVYADHIIIKRGSRYEKLRFSEESLLDAGIAVDESDLPQGDLQDEVPVPDEQYYDDEEEEGQPSAGRTRLRTGQRGRAPTAPRAPSPVRELIDTYRDRMASDPDSLLQELGLQSIDTAGTSGYQLGSELSARELQQAGLMPGDIVVSLNGQPVDDVMQNPAMVDAALAAGRVRVEIQRQDRRFFVTIPIR